MVLCDYGSGYQLVVLLLCNYLRICAGIVTENAENFVDENTVRPEVRIPQGTVRGINMITRHRKNFFGFKGIPFAKPPIGYLRFKGPVPANAWNRTLDASRDPNPCPQLDGRTFIGDEDCLYLNVYTPRLPASENPTLLPVMLFVFGGKFKAGDNNPMRWGPYFILDKDVLLVVPNYRQGVLGWLSTGDEVSPGNYGLKDLVQALEWNRDNIQYFGGDPNQVTIFGSSSGAINIHLLTLSDLTNGLFHRYIPQSGSALSPVAQRPRKSLANRTIQLAKYLDCPTNSSVLLVNCLRNLDAAQLVDTNSVFEVWNGFPIAVWGPTVEPDIEGALLTDTPANLFAAGKIRDLPWISSVTRNEGILLGSMFYERPDMFEEFLDKVDVVLPYILEYDSLVDNVTAYTVALKSFYLNDLTANRSLLLNNFTQLVGDALFKYPAYNGVEKHLFRASSPTYLCSFEYRGTFSYSYWFSGGSRENHGVSHGDENLYLFQHENPIFRVPELKMKETDWKMTEIIVQLWTSFAISGTPIISHSNTTMIWEPYSSLKNYLRIGNGSDTSIRVDYNFFEDRLHFWEELTAATTSR